MLNGQVAIVTGASRGIGEGILHALSKAGAIVIGTSTSEKGAEGIAKWLADAGAKGTGKVLDVRDSAACAAFADAVAAEFGPVGILVNNAGITKDNLLARMKDEEWDDVQATNLKSVFTLSRAVLRGMMKARTGRIVNVTSVVGHMGNAGQANYAASKAGTIGFTKSLAREVGSRNITVNCVAPGFIDTDMTRALGEDQARKLVENVPLGRLGRVDDVAQAVLFLCSPNAGYVTGSTVHVNGGLYMD
ncbi:3-oxoacyl-[acyl-carrier-protein] reductase FabG [Usitatibacter rugosus]|uniref:3-oxoacyl-[acyl-carrier-protein] reductase n=1 Tax=Usitatibacter rugosus TaxID=2732067 RepID=A0A6M4GVT6_9PROT|nr:3-oxoacyl-ACP reductase FabG [Usitatibacter rugosus]QJR11125.1 3-oxoacyl-[acyl-carrier-protein] reductase FabG [Usitatibacter rugosus]